MGERMKYRCGDCSRYNSIDCCDTKCYVLPTAKVCLGFNYGRTMVPITVDLTPNDNGKILSCNHSNREWGPSVEPWEMTVEIFEDTDGKEIYCPICGQRMILKVSYDGV